MVVVIGFGISLLIPDVGLIEGHYPDDEIVNVRSGIPERLPVPHLDS